MLEYTMDKYVHRGFIEYHGLLWFCHIIYYCDIKIIIYSCILDVYIGFIVTVKNKNKDVFIYHTLIYSNNKTTNTTLL